MSSFSRAAEVVRGACWYFSAAPGAPGCVVSAKAVRKGGVVQELYISDARSL